MVIFVSVSDSIVGHIQDADFANEAWDNLIAINANVTRARKIQLKNNLNTINKRGDLFVNDYALKNKGICESLTFIGVTVDDDDKVEACMCGLGNAYKQFKTSIRTSKSIPKKHSKLLRAIIFVGCLRRRVSLMMELYNQAKITLSRLFIQVQEEEESAVLIEVAMAIKAKVTNNTNKISSSLMDRDLCMVEDNLEARRVLEEVAKFSKK